MIERIIFHLPYQVDPNRPSASQIRPLKILKAFTDLGYKVDAVMGNSSLRKIKIEEIKRNIKEGIQYKLLYSESSTMPTLLTDSHHLPLEPFLDFSFFSFCKGKNIPIGLFYRDIHWVFPFYNKDASAFKKNIAKMFYKYDIYKYNKLVDVFFLPSFEMAEYIPNLKVPKIEELPPGLEFEHRSLNIHSKSSTEKLNILYVGGLSKDIYDIELFVKVVSQYIEFKLTICCREYDLRNLDPAVLDCFNNTRNVEIVHMHGEDLQYLYYNSDICCLFIKPIDYWNFAMPAKMFEYLSFLKPIIAVDNTVAGRFVKDNGWGWSIPYTNENLSSLLVEIKNNPSILERFRNYLVEGRENNTWKRRAETIVDKLCNKV